MATPPLAVDTSVAVPLIVDTHPDHRRVHRWLGGRRCALAGHALAETYSVITRLPGDMRCPPETAARLIAQFDDPLILGPDPAARIVATLAEAGITGGAVYDGLVALSAAEHGALLATRDARAHPTYAALHVETVIAD